MAMKMVQLIMACGHIEDRLINAASAERMKSIVPTMDCDQCMKEANQPLPTAVKD